MDTTQSLGVRGTPIDDGFRYLKECLSAIGGREALHLPLAYLGYLAVSALDGICTGLILLLGGMEANPIAASVLTHYGFHGMVLFKFTIVTFVIVICEQIVRYQPKTAKGVMYLAVFTTSVPVVLALVEFYFYATTWLLGWQC